MSETQKKSKETQKSGSFGVKNRLLWTFVFIAIAALSVWAVVSQTKDFSITEFVKFIKSSNPYWLGAAVVSMLGFIFFEAFALIYICRAFGHKTGIKGGFVYSAADIYVSAITPSATGGQPASAYFMMKDGLSGTSVTAALVCNLVMYTSAIVILGIFVALTSIGTFFGFSTVSKILIVLGVVVQIVLLFFFIMVLFKKGLLEKLCTIVIKFLGKLRIIRKVDKKLASLKKKMDNYSKHTSMLRGKGKLLVVVFIFNLLQRLSQVLVTPIVYLAQGGNFSKAYDIFITQIYVLLGSNCVPIPGSVGVTDYLMLDGLEMNAVNNFEYLELFSRFLSFYMCIIICGITLLCCCLSYSDKRRARKVKKQEAN